VDFLGTPDFYRFKKSYQLSGIESELTWYIDFSEKKGKVLSLHFETRHESSKLLANSLCQWAKGKSLGLFPQSNEVESQSLFSPVLLSFRLFNLELLGRSRPFHVQKGQMAEELTCRCFGVYRQEIISLLSEGGTEHSKMTIGAALRAGIGCGSCHFDLDQLLDLLGHNDKAIVEKSWRDMNEQTLSETCRDLLKPWGEARLIGLKPGGVLIKANAEIRDAIKEAIEKELGHGLAISFH